MPVDESDLTTPLIRDVQGRYICNTFDEARATWENGPGFDVVIVGGGTYGGVIAQNLYFRSEAFSSGDPFAPRNYRILVLEAGPYILPEHVQNLPQLRLFDPPATSLEALQPDPAKRGSIPPRNEVWGLAWHSPEPFVGLAYCLGGRSLYWGGWSPIFLDSEMPTVGPYANVWPASTVEDLKVRFFDEANRQLGSIQANDFINGKLHEALRDRLLRALKEGKIPNAFRLDDLPAQITEPPLDGLNTAVRRREEERRKLDAPYAVTTSARSGFFPANKFSSMPLLIAAARDAQRTSEGDDNRKRLMIVPNCHVIRLDTETVQTATGDPILRVKGLETNLGYVPLPADKHGAVVLAAAGIESTRLALLSFGALPVEHHQRIGKNLMAHTRANMFFRVPRSAMPELDAALGALEVAALQIRGRHVYPDGTLGHYHLQITASGAPSKDANADRELFQKVPDLDHYQRFLSEEIDDVVAVAIRAIAEMEPQNEGSYVRLDAERDEFGVERAFVALNQVKDEVRPAMDSLTDRDRTLFETMKAAMFDVARLFDPELRNVEFRVDPLGTTHHEAGTLWMGDDPEISVTNPDGRFHQVANAFVGDLSVLPTVGSINPMLPGVALVRRLAKHLVPEGDGRLAGDPTPIKPYKLPIGAKPVEKPALPPPDPDGFQPLFDGTTANWRMAGRGQFFVIGDTLQTLPGTDLGLVWCTIPTPPNFVLQLGWFLAARDGRSIFAENSGVFVRFPHPDSQGFHNPAWVPVIHGFEIQIDPDGRAPDGRFDVPEYQTGAIYSFGRASRVDAPAGRWNRMEIRVEGQTYTTLVNGEEAAVFTYDGNDRAQPSTAEAPTFIGLQAYSGAKAAFRNIRIRPA